MPVLQSNFLKRGAPKQLYEMGISGSGSGSDFSQTIANSQLDIQANSLQKDGILNLSDYDALIKKAEKLKSNFNPATQSGRNAIANLDKQISNFDLAKTKLEQESGDLEQINFNTKNVLKSIELRNGIDPEKHLNETTELYKSTIDQLSDKFLYAQGTGNFKEANELQNAVDEYKFKYDNNVSLLAKVQSIKQSFLDPEANKLKDIAAFIQTDTNGIITGIYYKTPYSNDVKGFNPTNAYLNGIQIYLNPVRRPDGINHAFLGDKEFDDSKGTLFQQALTGETNANKPLMYGFEDVFLTPKDLQMRGHIPEGGFARAGDTLYKNVGNGRFTKFKNATIDDLRLSPMDYQDVNSSWENKMNMSVIDTIDLKNNDTLKQIEAYKSPDIMPSLMPKTNDRQIQRDLMRSQASMPKNTAPTKPATEPRRGLRERAEGFFKGLNPMNFLRPQQETNKPTQNTIDTSWTDYLK